MTATMTAGGIGLFLLLWAWIRSQSIFTILLATFGAALLGSGILTRLAHGVIGMIATVLNGVGGAM